ncbi:oxidoreductase-like domain-containing protein [Chitiniphilus purpureus]|uniref:Oxidoreductase-like domain-containing protein n=1 Tax=Chitiniphilus purpureus TaxID=2981137 RepID=A0ABY6DJZ6_9NEIS|nr:oxidoreductase-like domain-containing protein [Chitiniphilus sp. CD1]UXY14652.1 oxidoreductase-like domain-containing protein [Chitiniphilus sp. CD1]
MTEHLSDPPAHDPPPEPPYEPALEECCGNGCTPCIFDTYNAQLQQYRRLLAEWQARQAVRQGNA